MQFVTIEAVWKDTNERFEALCAIGEPCENVDDDLIFFYFEDENEILEDIFDFYILDYTKED